MPRADPLALSPVPLPAPATHPWRDLALAAGFCAALALGGIGALRERAAPQFEFRTLAPWPAPKFLRTFPGEFERAFGDRFGGRGAMLLLHDRAMVGVFGVSPAPNVMIGRDGWLYFLGEEGQALNRHYRGTLPIGDAEIAAVATELMRRQRFLASLGIPYVVTIVPDKFTIYPEHLPEWVGAPKAPTPMERLIAVLQADGNVRVVDLRAPLRDAKARGRVYHATDSHWNLPGAAVGYDAIMREVQRALPPGGLAAIAPAAMPPYVPGVDVCAGVWHGRGLSATLSPGRLRRSRAAGRPGGAAPAASTTLQTQASRSTPAKPAPARGRYRDSMAIPLIPLLSNFSRAVMAAAAARPGTDPARAPDGDRGNGRTLAAGVRCVADAGASSAPPPALPRHKGARGWVRPVTRRVRPCAVPLQAQFTILRVSVLRPTPPRGRFHPMAAGVGERAPDERLFELLLQPVADVALAARQRLRELAVERLLPADVGGGRAACVRHFAHFRRKVGDLDALPRAHHRQPVTDVLELPHVTGECKRRQHF
jgi:hypothetical protein